MLTLIQRARINEKKKHSNPRLTNKDLATLLDVKYGTLTMVLSGTYENEEVETKLLNWLKNTKNS